MAELQLSQQQWDAITQPADAFLGGRPFTPLWVAVACGSADAAEQLMKAGAYETGMFTGLVTVAKRANRPQAERHNSGAGSGSNVEAVQTLVRRGAEALLSRGLPPGRLAEEAHRAAVMLAHPATWTEPGLPACPWLLQHLLRLHTSGQLGGAAYASAVGQVLVSSQPVDDAALVPWLGVPAAAALPREVLAICTTEMCSKGRERCLAALLAREEVQQAVQQPGPGYGQSVGTRAILAAASAGHGACIDALLAAGAQITMATIQQCITNCVCSPSNYSHSACSLELLLRRTRPPVPFEGASLTSCPIYYLLDSKHTLDDMVVCPLVWFLWQSPESRADRRLADASWKSTHGCQSMFVH